MFLLQNIISNLQSIMLALAGISLVTVFHEFGHFIFAKLFNVLAPGFSVGFGPKILSKKLGETEFSLSAIPLGGYVEMSTDDPERSFESISYWKKFIIISAGIVFNLIFTFIIFVGLLYTGAPYVGPWAKEQAPVIEKIEPTSAFYNILNPGDQIIEINSVKIDSLENLSKTLTIEPSKEITIKYLRNNQSNSVQIPADQIQSGLKLSWQFDPQLCPKKVKAKLSLSDSFKQAATTTSELFTAIAKALTNIFKNKKSLLGPIGMISQISKCASWGLKPFLAILAILSINLAVFNIIPLPILDGGQLLITTVESALGKKLEDKTKERVYITTWVFMGVLTILLSIKDIIQLIK